MDRFFNLKLLRTLIDTIPIPVFFKDENGKYRFCNKAFESFYGAMEEDILGKTVFDMGPQEIAEKYHEKDQELFDNPGVQEYEWKVMGLDGREKDVLFHKATVTNESGMVIGIIGTIQDITEQKQKQAASKRELMLTNALARLYTPLITPQIPLSEIARVVLEEAKKVTASDHGFVGVISPLTRHLVSLTLTDMLEGQCRIEDIDNQRIVFPVNDDGTYSSLWGHALNTREAFFTNETSGHSSSSGIPSGHIPLDGFLAVPVILQGDIVGLIGLSHPKAPYVIEDIASVKRIAEFYALAIRKKRVEEHVAALLNESISANKKLKISEEALSVYSASLEKNIEEAMEYQQKLVSLQFPSCGTIQITGNYYPCQNISGDIYNVVQTGNKIVFYLCDVAGHGVSAAMLSTFVKAYLDDWIRYHKITSPEILVNRLRSVLVGQDLFAGKFVTMFAGSYNLSSGTLQWVSAGHPMPLLSDSEIYPLDDIVNSQPLLSGLLPEVEYKNNVTKITNGIRFLLYSDGLIEWSRDGENVFGTQQLTAMLHKKDISSASVKELIDEIQMRVPADDISCIIINFSPKLDKTYYTDMNRVDTVLDEFEEFIQGRYTEDIFYRALQCFSECILNAVEHGNKNNPEKKTKVRVQCLRKKLVFSVQDEGDMLRMPFLKRIRLPRGLAVRGRGLYLVKKFANKVRIAENKNMIVCEIY